MAVDNQPAIARPSLEDSLHQHVSLSPDACYRPAEQGLAKVRRTNTRLHHSPALMVQDKFREALDSSQRLALEEFTERCEVGLRQFIHQNLCTVLF